MGYVFIDKWRFTNAFIIIIIIYYSFNVSINSGNLCYIFMATYEIVYFYTWFPM